MQVLFAQDQATASRKVYVYKSIWIHITQRTRVRPNWQIKAHEPLLRGAGPFTYILDGRVPMARVCRQPPLYTDKTGV